MVTTVQYRTVFITVTALSPFYPQSAVARIDRKPKETQYSYGSRRYSSGIVL